MENNVIDLWRVGNLALKTAFQWRFRDFLIAHAQNHQ